MTGATRSSLRDYLDELRTEVDAALDRVLAARARVGVIDTPVRYALLGPGKRLRPCLALAVAESVAPRSGMTRDAARHRAMPAACAVEMIHAYSLVHDDLPAMDNDDLRRGRPTTHVVYGDGLAILAGDALLTEAFAVLAESPSTARPGGDDGEAVPGSDDGRDAGRRLRAIATLAASAGIQGMVGGQALDLAAVSAGAAPFTPDTLEDMHARKTGALIRAACTAGAILAGASEDVIRAIDAYARDLGLAFQIIDDVLDVEGSNDAIGKTAGKDAAAGKPTFPMFYGIEGSRRRAADCITRATAALAPHGLGGRLNEIAEWSLGRSR